MPQNSFHNAANMFVFIPYGNQPKCKQVKSVIQPTCCDRYPAPTGRQADRRGHLLDGGGSETGLRDLHRQQTGADVGTVEIR